MFRHLGGDPVEVFEAEDGTRAEHDPDTSRIDGVKVTDSWRLGQVLPGCLGSPLTLPPAGDVAGFRRLIWDGTSGAWALDLSGANLCSLSGRLVLHLDSPQADTGELSVDGVSWKDGGLEAAQALLGAEVRRAALADWTKLSQADRRDVVHALAHDTDDDAEDVLRELLAQEPGAEDVQRALEERALRTP
ncbi:MAG: hypothetical protein GY913_25160 [Proteobacteria bacterium]|nr:hypothetical protein [Pseudomonadota bacterium]MCP4920203.1 hypothetical protein [Pseudomonadota bacterium]